MVDMYYPLPRRPCIKIFTLWSKENHDMRRKCGLPMAKAVGSPLALVGRQAAFPWRITPYILCVDGSVQIELREDIILK